MFCGALSLEAALELVDARHDALKGVSAKAVSVVGDADVEDGLVDASKHGEIAVSHDLCPGVRVVSGSRDAVAAFEVPGAVLTETDARQGAHSPLAADAAAAYDAARRPRPGHDDSVSRPPPPSPAPAGGAGRDGARGRVREAVPRLGGGPCAMAQLDARRRELLVAARASASRSAAGPPPTPRPDFRRSLLYFGCAAAGSSPPPLRRAAVVYISCARRVPSARR